MKKIDVASILPSDCPFVGPVVGRRNAICGIMKDLPGGASKAFILGCGEMDEADAKVALVLAKADLTKMAPKSDLGRECDGNPCCPLSTHLASYDFDLEKAFPYLCQVVRYANEECERVPYNDGVVRGMRIAIADSDFVSGVYLARHRELEELGNEKWLKLRRRKGLPVRI